ncbi:MAG: family 20 glycosylhydrolase [Bacteroidota bacterium]
MKFKKNIRNLLHLILTVFFLLFVSCTDHYNVNENTVNIIPKPIKIEVSNGTFSIQKSTQIFVETNNKDAKDVAKYFADRIRTVIGYDLTIESYTAESNNFGAILISTKNADPNLGDEGYTLEVNKKSVAIKASKAAGLFYGVQSLLQLLPPEIYGSEKLNKGINWSIPVVKISDKPRFTWRGMHLDVSRHFFSKEVVKRYIDLLAMHKMNTFHWHLVDDQGWRIEIKKYPKLIEIGSSRADLPWNDWQGKETNDTPVYSGYYTQEDIKEIVAYAQRRFITIVPEIEMPGHTLAALASYPEYSCTGSPFIVPSGGVDIWKNHTYCIGNEKTYKFLEDILAEVMELFPSEYIHVGGDETTRLRWESCPKCQARINSEGLNGEDELYGYFLKRMRKFLDSRDRKLIGWDEILEGGENLNATVMSWRGVDRCNKAVARKLDVVLSPSSHLYFDDHEEGGESRVPLEMVYSYDPVPIDLNSSDEKYILGAQACVWTENVTSGEQIEKITLPRMAALAEVIWSNKNNQNYEEFLRRLSHHYSRFDAMNLNYRQPDLEGGFNGVHVFTDSIQVKIIKPRLNSEAYYTLDGSEPTKHSSMYSKPFYLTESTILKAKEYLSDGTEGCVRTGIYDKQELLVSVKVDNVQPGLYYQYVEGIYDLAEQVPLDQYKESGVIDSFVFPTNHRKKYFGTVYSGFIRLPDDGIYTFYCETNDGSQLYIGNKIVVEHGGLHPAEEKSASIALQAGYHSIRVIYFQNAGSSFLKISYSGVNIDKQEIPGSVLFHKK